MIVNLLQPNKTFSYYNVFEEVLLPKLFVSAAIYL